MLSSRIRAHCPPPKSPLPTEQKRQKKNKRSCLFSTKVLKLLLLLFFLLPPFLSFLTAFSSSFFFFFFDFIAELWQLSSLLGRPQICISRFAGSPVHRVTHGQTTQASRLNPSSSLSPPSTLVLWWAPFVNNGGHTYVCGAARRSRTCHLKGKSTGMHYQQYTFKCGTFEGNEERSFSSVRMSSTWD